MSHNHPDEHYEQRIASLEESLKELRKDQSALREKQFDAHKWYTTIVFSLVALLLTVLGISNKSDVRDAIAVMKSDAREATTDMRNKVNDSTAEMEKKINALTGEALKKPVLEISTTGGLLNGREFVTGGGSIPFYPLFVKNTGDKQSGALSIRLYTSSSVNFSSSEWVPTASDDKDYPASYYFQFGPGGSPVINPAEPWTFATSDLGYYLSPGTTNRLIECKLLIFYGVEKPAEAKFRIKFQ